MGQRASSIEKSTGVSWDDWTAWLETEGATTMQHPDIATLVERRIHELKITTHATNGKPFNRGWWAQGIAIEFEHDHGMRAEGQSSNGDFFVSATTTLTGTIDEALKRWLELMTGRTHIGGVALVGEPSVSETQKWRYWKASFDDGSHASVTMTAKKVPENSAPKVALAANQTRLDSADAGETWRARWKVVLAEL